MKQLLAILFILNLFSPAYAQQMKRSISIELEAVEGATSYEVELSSKKSGKTATFKMKDPTWKANVSTGEYTLRLRSYDERGVPGPWSESAPFNVQLPIVTLTAPAQNAEIKTKQAKEYPAEFSWEPVSGAEKYKIEITGEQFTAAEEVEEPHINVKLPVAKSYTWTVVALDKKGQSGDAQETKNTFTLIGAPLEAPEIEKPEDIYVEKVKWEKSEFATSYSYALVNLSEQKKPKADQSNNQSEPDAPTDSNRKIASEKEVNKTEIPFSTKYAGGKYRFSVKAHAPKREDSAVAKVEFDVWAGDRNPAAIENAKLRASLDKSTNWYGIASWLYSPVTYTGINSEQTNGLGEKRQIQYDAEGGTGRIGVGYIKPKRNTGYFGILDLTGMTISKTNVTYAAAELHHVWRYTWGRNMLRPSAGLFYKELIETKDTLSTQLQFEHEKISMMGPHVGFDFWRPFTSKFGMQINARLYLAATGKTPNGQEFVEGSAVQLGVMGSYKLKSNLTGFMGLAHRSDYASYKSDPSAYFIATQADPDDKQEITLESENFNIMLEWGF